jgi:hypothetical protein
MSTKYEPSQKEREEALEAFKYELEMLRLAVARHLKEQGKQDKLVSNAMLECALLHTRNILDFFTGKKSNKNDIIALHFVNKSPQLPYIKSLRNNINKSLSHLTYTRVEVGKKYEWDLPKIRGEIEETYSEFFISLSDEEKAKWPEP